MRARLHRSCSLCGKIIKIILYEDGTYRGGNYWDFDLGKPDSPPRVRGLKGITQEIAKEVIDYAHEYWECAACFRR